jgi:uncharacterized protein
LLDYILEHTPSSLIAAQNAAGSTALHWAALNAQLAATQRLVRAPDGPGAALIDIKNAAGRSPLGEAEVAGWDEGARWMVEVMTLDEKPAGEADAEDDIKADMAANVEIEIQDADGQVARMNLGPTNHPQDSAPSSQ